MRNLEEIDRDLEIAYADMASFIKSGFPISPILEDDIDELRDERAAVVKAMQNAGLMRYEVCILPKPENTASYCAAQAWPSTSPKRRNSSRSNEHAMQELVG